MRNVNEIINFSQDVSTIVLFMSVVLFVFMIYVGICIITIKNDLKKLVNSELDKQEKEKDQKTLVDNEKE